jgi:MFS family permease
LSLAETGKILSMMSVGMMVGSPVVSFLSEKVFKSRLKVLKFFSSLLMGEMLFMAIFYSGLSIWMLYLIFVLFSISSFAIVVIGFTMTKELFPVEIAGTSLGAVNIFPFLGGAVFQPMLGHLLDLYPVAGSNGYSTEAYEMMLLVLFVASVAVVASTLVMKETFPRS